MQSSWETSFLIGNGVKGEIQMATKTKAKKSSKTKASSASVVEQASEEGLQDFHAHFGTGVSIPVKGASEADAKERLISAVNKDPNLFSKEIVNRIEGSGAFKVSAVKSK